VSTQDRTRIAIVGLFVGLALNVTGWLGNNLVLGSLWTAVEVAPGGAAWRATVWSDVPDVVYGLAIAWLCVALRPSFDRWLSASLASGVLVAVTGGITTYFAVANSGFVPWSLALASFVLVAVTKIPLALAAGWILEA
jgi:hypothetical protein